MNRRVALEVISLFAQPEQAQGLPRAKPERRVGSQCDRDVELEDLLRDALVGIFGSDEEDHRDRARHQRDGTEGERGNAVIP